MPRNGAAKPPRDSSPISSAEAARLFSDLKGAGAIVLAVSGGPDSTALLWLASQWRQRLKAGPELLAVTIDHGLRKAGGCGSASGEEVCRIVARAAHDAALVRRKAAAWIACRCAGSALCDACQGRAQVRRGLHPHRAYARRPGRDVSDAPVARQRARRACGDGAAIRARRRGHRAPAAGCAEGPADRDARQGEDRVCGRSHQSRRNVSRGRAGAG